MSIQKTRHKSARKNASPRGFWIAGNVPLVYINMPKSGCTTIKNILHRIDSGSFIDDPLTIHGRKDLFIDPVNEREIIADRLKNAPVFTFVRHPLKRSYSCFNEKIHFRSQYSFGKARDYIEKEYGAVFEENPSIELHRENFKKFLKFSKDSFDGKNGWRRDPHWCPQSMVLNDLRKWRHPDFIGRVEKFDDHMNLIMNMAGVDYNFDTPRMNEGPPPPWKYDDIIDDEIISLGKDFFKADFRKFGYSV